MIEYVAPAPDVTDTTPAHTDLVTPERATKYIAPAHVAPSLDLVNPQISIGRVEEQIVAGKTIQNIVGSLAVPKQVILQEIPEVQIIGRTQEQIEEQIGDIPVPQIVEDTVEVMQIIPQERLQRHPVNHEQIDHCRGDGTERRGVSFCARTGENTRIS